MSRRTSHDNGSDHDVSKNYEEAFRRLAEVREQLHLLKSKAESLGQKYQERVTASHMIPPVELPV